MEWISVKDALPEIPEGKYGMSVIGAVFDAQYEECCPGHGYDVSEVHYGTVINRDGKRLEYFNGIEGDLHFMEWYHGSTNELGPLMDEITHWQPLPEPPTYIAE